jgi:hypothetical protein
MYVKRKTLVMENFRNISMPGLVLILFLVLKIVEITLRNNSYTQNIHSYTISND